MRILLAIAAMACASVTAIAGDGIPDPMFGVGGLARTGLVDATFPSNGGILNIKPVVHADGSFLICGTEATSGTSGKDFYVARFTRDGVPDTSFNFDGKVRIDFDGGGGGDYCTAIAEQADGRVVVAGYTFLSPSATGARDFAIARLNTDGTLDTSFGAGTGKKIVAMDLGGSNDDVPYALAIQPDQKIVLAGFATTAAGTEFAILRLIADGTPDSSFNLTGKVFQNFNLASGAATNQDIATGVAIDAAGNIVVGGYANKGPNTSDIDFAVLRLTTHGVLDSNFNANGMATIAFDLGGVNGTNNDQAFALMIQHDGKIVLGGIADSSTTSTGNFDMAIARLLPNGSPDASFGSAGKVLVPFDLTANGEDIALALAEQSNGKLVIGGTAGGPNPGPTLLYMAAARLNRDGGLDNEFGALGKQTYEMGLSTPSAQLIYGIGLQGTQIIANGLASDTATGGFDNVILRLQTDLIFADGAQ